MRDISHVVVVVLVVVLVHPERVAWPSGGGVSERRAVARRGDVGMQGWCDPGKLSLGVTCWGGATRTVASAPMQAELLLTCGDGAA